MSPDLQARERQLEAEIQNLQTSISDDYDYIEYCERGMAYGSRGEMNACVDAARTRRERIELTRIELNKTNNDLLNLRNFGS